MSPAPLPLDRSSFAPGEEALASYLTSLADIANGVATDPRGTITGGWWRAGERPFDARVQEYGAILVWFLTQRRRWNPYRGDDALRQRTAAVLERHLELQHRSGAWPEYAPQQHSRSATGFALESLTASLRRLVTAGELAELHQPIADALRRGIDWYLTPANTEVWWPGYTPIANQPAGALSGTLAFLHLVVGHDLEAPGDTERLARAEERLLHLLSTSQSATGFFHEPTGSDLGYSYRVMLPRLAELAALAPPTTRAAVTAAAGRFVAWYGLNAALEPDGVTYLLNVAGNARTGVATRQVGVRLLQPDDRVAALVADVPALAAFVPAVEDVRDAHLRWASDPDGVPPLPFGTSPAGLDTVDPTLLVTHAAQVDAQACLPHLASDHWTRLLSEQGRQHFWFLRRRGYYLCATFGVRASSTVRTGPGLLWHPQLGTVVHGRNGDEAELWTVVGPEGAVLAAEDAFGQFFDGPPPDADLIADPGAATAAIGLRLHDGANRAQVDWTCDEATINCTVHATTPVGQRIPLLLRGTQRVSLANRGATVTDPAVPGAGLTIRWSDDIDAALTEAADRPFPGAIRHVLELRQRGVGPFHVQFHSVLGRDS